MRIFGRKKNRGREVDPATDYEDGRYLVPAHELNQEQLDRRLADIERNRGQGVYPRDASTKLPKVEGCLLCEQDEPITGYRLVDRYDPDSIEEITFPGDANDSERHQAMLDDRIRVEEAHDMRDVYPVEFVDANDPEKGIAALLRENSRRIEPTSCPLCGHAATKNDPCVCDIDEEGYWEKLDKAKKERTGEL